jgi:hypothetical protein
MNKRRNGNSGKTIAGKLNRENFCLSIEWSIFLNL